MIGCCFNVDKGEISFYRNGRPLGTAFNNVRRHVPGVAYFPAFSLSHGERCVTNFGNRPFRYPIHGFTPIQKGPAASLRQVGTLILECIKNFSTSHIIKTSLTIDRGVTNINAWMNSKMTEKSLE